jgi:hypothetical protein
MSWFSRGSASRKEQGATQTEVEPEVHRSLAMATLFEEIRKRPKLQVLDLGSVVGSNVEFLSQYGCKLYIEDLYAALSSAQRGEGEIVSPEFFAEFLSLPDDTRFDVVFAWDIFNYLQRKELAYLGLQLRRFCPPGALLFAQISILKQIPAQPYRYKIKDEQNLIYERRTPTERPSPRFAPAEVTGLLKGFRVDRSFLLKHGIQEYLLLREE